MATAPGYGSKSRGLAIAVEFTVSALTSASRETSLGSAQTMTLAEARIAANDARKLVASGLNPIEERRKAKEPWPSTPTVGDRALALIRSKHETRPKGARINRAANRAK